MLQHEAHVNTFDKINGSSPLHDACFSGSLKSLVCLPPPLASALLSLEAEAVSCLWVCCRCVKALVEAGANVNMHTKSTKDKNKGAVALHYAAQENRHDIVEYLIRKSAGVNIQDARGCTPLHYAAYKGPSSTAIQRAFARACTRLRCANCLHHLYGASKAHAGCLWRCGGAGSGDAVRVLLQNKADKDRTNHDGNTAAKLMQTSQMVDKESKARMLEMLHGAPSQGKQGGCVIC